MSLSIVTQTPNHRRARTGDRIPCPVRTYRSWNCLQVAKHKEGDGYIWRRHRDRAHPGNRIGEINARRTRIVPALTYRGIVTGGPPALYRPTERAFASGPDATIVAQSGDRL